MSGKSALERMKTKSCSVLLVVIVISSASLWFLSYPASTSFQTVMAKTQTSIKSLPDKLKKDEGRTVDPRYLQRLGLAPPTRNVSTSPDSMKVTPSPSLPTPRQTSGPPVIASGVRPDHFDEAATLMDSVLRLLPSYNLIMYDLGLSSSEKFMLKKYCNSTWRCETRMLEFEKYPSHLKYLEIGSYRPVCIQEMLNEHGAVVWADNGYYFTSGNLSLSVGRAKESGIQGWRIKDPTSSFTHQKMFEFFKMEPKDFYFQHPIEASHLVMYNSEHLVKTIMLPWVKCALLEECVNPLGAQNTGCLYNRRPYYLYQGCHRYDMSALNVLLGKAFSLDEEPYTSTEKVWGNTWLDKLRAENRTQPSHEVGFGLIQR